MADEGPVVGRRVPHLGLAGLALLTGCNAAFGIEEGERQPICADPLLIDDMEDGVGDICDSGQRHGYWFAIGDDSGGTLEPAQGALFAPTLLAKSRGTSRYAAHLSGSGLTDWGALMGFDLNTVLLSKKTYDVGIAGGIKFWMKSNVPVLPSFSIPETIPVSQGDGTCVERPGEWNCENHFGSLFVPPNTTEWTEYTLPFAALRQRQRLDANVNLIGGSTQWDPSHLISIQFIVQPAPGEAFDTWVDDVQFYYCSGARCLPSCVLPRYPVACPASGRFPAGCWPDGTACSSRLNGDLARVWGSGSADVWAVGPSHVGPTSGIIQHWNGSVWSSTSSDITHPLWGLWSSGPNDAWAVGDFGSIFHWDGSVWSASTTGSDASMNEVWGSGPNDIWAVSTSGSVLHWDGAAWSTSTSVAGTALWDISGSGPDDVWAVGDEDTVLHWDGVTWFAGTSGLAVAFSSVWSNGPSDVWAVAITSTPEGAILHWDGSTWSSSAHFPTIFLSSIWGAAASDLWAVGGSTSGEGAILHWNGSSWSIVAKPPTLTLYEVWGSGPNDVWAVGAWGVTVHWDGTSWTIMPNALTQ